MRRISIGMAFLALTLAAPAFAHEGSATGRTSQAQFHDAMRKLWEDHVTYTAFFYKAAINGGDDVGKVAERLLRNQDDIGNAVKPFYGEAAGNRLAALLREHILIAADLVKAADLLPECWASCDATSTLIIAPAPGKPSTSLPAPGSRSAP